MDKALPGARLRDLMAYDENGVWIWATAPRSYFASKRDHRR